MALTLDQLNTASLEQALQWLEKATANGNLDATTLLERLRNDATK